MNIKKELSKPYLMNEKISFTRNQLEECEMYIDRLSPFLFCENTNKNQKEFTNKDQIINLFIYRERLINEVNTLYKHKLDVCDLIDSLENELDKLIMKKHYLSYESWTKISEDLSMTYQTVYTHHKKPLKELERMFSYKKQI